MMLGNMSYNSQAGYLRKPFIMGLQVKVTLEDLIVCSAGAWWTQNTFKTTKLVIPGLP